MLVTIFSAHCNAATWLDPSLKWKTLETPHFSINYYPEEAEIAYRLAPIAEEVNETMTKVFRSKLDMKTQVSLMDITDYGNGMTTVFPYPSITLYLTDLSSNLNPYKYDNYLRYLFLHEYTHALHLDMIEGGLKIFRTVFGRVMFPNSLEPWFLTEGIATYMETKYTKAGRGRDPRWAMMMRLDVLEDNVKTIDQAAVDTIKWPLGDLRYLYGVEFLKYLSDQYGEDKLITLTHVYGDFIFTEGVDGAFIYVYGRTLPQLWQAWLAHLRDKYQREKSALGKLTEPQLLTRSGYQNLKPKWSKDGRYLYYVEQNADDYPQLRRLEVKTGRAEKILEGMFSDENKSLSPDGQTLLLSKADTYRNYYTYKDIYALDLASNKMTRLTNGERASDPCYSPDGSEFVYVKNGLAGKSLWISGQQRPLASAETESQYFSPIFSPDGKYIYVPKKVGSGGERLYLIEPSTGRQVELTDTSRPTDDAISEANPAFSPAGDYLFYDADYNGIVNLYAYHIATNRLFQVTNVIGGAMMPDVSPDGKQLAYVSYSSRGYDLAVLDIDPSAWQEVTSNRNDPGDGNDYGDPITVAQAPAVQTLEVHDYNPWPTLRPRFWIPDSFRNENGLVNSVYIGGMDPLGQHFYYLSGGFDFTWARGLSLHCFQSGKRNANKVPWSIHPTEGSQSYLKTGVAQ